MSTDAWVGSQNDNASASSFFWHLGFTANFANTTEADQKQKWAAGTFTDLNSFVSASASTMACTVRINGASGNNSATLGSSVTGWTTDSTHTDTISAGDTVAYRTSTGGGSVTNKGGTSAKFNVSGSGAIISFAARSDTNLASGNNGNEAPLCGQLDFTATTANNRTQLKVAGTLDNLGIDMTNQASAGTIVFVSKKAGASGNLTVSFASGVNGDTYDTTHSDTVAAADEWSYSYSGITTNFSGAKNVKVRFTATSTTHDMVSQRVSATDSTTYTTRYITPTGGALDTISTTEANNQSKAPLACAISHLRLHSRNSNLNQAQQTALRKATVTVNNVGSLASSTSGWGEDTTHTDVLAKGDQISTQWSTTSTSGSARLQGVAMLVGPGTNTETGTATMTFAGISFTATGTAPLPLGTGAMHFSGVSFTAAATRTETGTGAMHFGGISIIALAQRIHVKGTGAMAFAGLSIHAAGAVPTGAGTGLRQFSTFG